MENYNTNYVDENNAIATVYDVEQYSDMLESLAKVRDYAILEHQRVVLEKDKASFDERLAQDPSTINWKTIETQAALLKASFETVQALENKYNVTHPVSVE